MRLGYIGMPDWQSKMMNILSGRGRSCIDRGNSREEFYHILEKNMQPVYDSAKRQGYDIWN